MYLAVRYFVMYNLAKYIMVINLRPEINFIQAIEVRSNGRMSTKKISRRQLLKSSGMHKEHVSQQCAHTSTLFRTTFNCEMPNSCNWLPVLWFQAHAKTSSDFPYFVMLGLRLRDTRSVDPSLWLMNSMPSLLVIERFYI